MKKVKNSRYKMQVMDYLSSYNPSELLLDYVSAQCGPISEEELLEFINSYEYKKTLLEFERMHSKLVVIAQAAKDAIDEEEDKFLDEYAKTQAQNNGQA